MKSRRMNSIARANAKEEGSGCNAKLTYHNLDHHTTISTRKAASSKTVHELRHHRTV